jgi:hypothetical protein
MVFKILKMLNRLIILLIGFALVGCSSDAERASNQEMIVGEWSMSNYDKSVIQSELDTGYHLFIEVNNQVKEIMDNDTFDLRFHNDSMVKRMWEGSGDFPLDVWEFRILDVTDSTLTTESFYRGGKAILTRVN